MKKKKKKKRAGPEGRKKREEKDLAHAINIINFLRWASAQEARAEEEEKK